MMLSADEHDLKVAQFHDTKDRLDANKPTQITRDSDTLDVRIGIITGELRDILQLEQEPARTLVESADRDGASAS